MPKVAQAFPPDDGFLTDDERLALQMRYAKKASLAEIARRLDRPTKAVAFLLARGLVKLRKRPDSLE
jgi:DNA-directed RNA polymerase specialized sigma24 family protein